MGAYSTVSDPSKESSGSIKKPVQFNLKSLLLLPVLIVVSVGVSHSIYLLGLSLGSSVTSIDKLPDWTILGWGIQDDLPGWLLLMVVAFFLGLVRSTRAHMAAWLLCFSMPLSEAFLFRNLPFLSALEAGAVQIIGSLLGGMAWFVGWWIRGRKSTTATENGARWLKAGAVVMLRLMVVLISVNGWWLLNMNTIQVARQVRASEFESLDVFIVPEDATKVSHHLGAYESLHVAYGLTQKYPATKTIQEISERLKRLGWEPLQTDWLNPGISSSHVDGWNDSVDATRNQRHRVHQWMGQWQDNSGNLVDYTFRYTYPINGPPNFTSLWVNGSWYPAESVKLMQMTLQ